jgi:hypothetical protein
MLLPFALRDIKITAASMFMLASVKTRAYQDKSLERSTNYANYYNICKICVIQLKTFELL